MIISISTNSRIRAWIANLRFFSRLQNDFVWDERGAATWRRWWRCRAQEKLIRGPLMAQQKRAQQGQDDKSICILWMDERGERGMDARNILPRCILLRVHASLTWLEKRGREDWARPKKKKATIRDGERAGERWGRPNRKTKRRRWKDPSCKA